jgi:hypothetical protein
LVQKKKKNLYSVCLPESQFSRISCLLLVHHHTLSVLQNKVFIFRIWKKKHTPTYDGPDVDFDSVSWIDWCALFFFFWKRSTRGLVLPVVDLNIFCHTITIKWAHSFFRQFYFINKIFFFLSIYGKLLWIFFFSLLRWWTSIFFFVQ